MAIRAESENCVSKARGESERESGRRKSRISVRHVCVSLVNKGIRRLAVTSASRDPFFFLCARLSIARVSHARAKAARREPDKIVRRNSGSRLTRLQKNCTLIIDDKFFFLVLLSCFFFFFFAFPITLNVENVRNRIWRLNEKDK